ncbi:hypothetical protein HanPSC8_Chr04g0144311 [Helianthus annuus]|nr:hypothetical protein HanPSC8_Chr04g0144311 [Helianthus annuus]
MFLVTGVLKEENEGKGQIYPSRGRHMGDLTVKINTVTIKDLQCNENKVKGFAVQLLNVKDVHCTFS